MSKQGSNHDMPEIGEDDEDLDLPSPEQWEADAIEYGEQDFDWRDHLDEEDEEGDDHDWDDDPMWWAWEND